MPFSHSLLPNNGVYLSEMALLMKKFYDFHQIDVKINRKQRLRIMRKLTRRGTEVVVTGPTRNRVVG